MRLIVHAGEQHILGVFVLILVRNNKVRVFLILCFLFLSAVNRRTFRHFRLAYIAICLQGYLRSVGLPVQQGAVSILVTAQVRTEREDVFRRILIHWRVGNRANYDERVARIAYHQHQHTQQSRILQAGRNQVFGPFVDSFLIVKQEADNAQNDDSDNNRTPSIAIERYADEAKGNEERYIFTLFIAVNVALVDGPQHSCHKKDDVNNKSGIEREAETIHKQQFKPSADSYNSRYDAVENGCHDGKRNHQCHQRTSGLDVGKTAVTVHQHDGRQAQQVQQMHANAQPRHVKYQH